MNIYDYIKSKYLRLSKGQRKVAQFILEKPEAIVANIASEVGRLAGVSESTVIRFCYAIELSGYGELQQKINEYLMLNQTLSSPVIEKKVTSDEVKGSMLAHAKQISEVIQRMDSKQILNAVNAIKSANKKYVVGLNNNKLLATILNEGVCDCEKISDYESIFKMLEVVTENDVVILLDDPTSPQYIENIIYSLEKINASIVFIHEKKANPLRKKCTVNLYLGEKNMMDSFGAFSLAKSLVDSLEEASITNKELVNL